MLTGTKYTPDAYEDRDGKRVGVYWFKCRSAFDTRAGVQVLAKDADEACERALPKLLTVNRPHDVHVARLDGGPFRRKKYQSRA